MARQLSPIALIVWCGTFALASAATTTLPLGFCSVGTEEAVACKKAGTVCAIKSVGDPDHGMAHNGTCHKFAPSLMCNHLPTATYYVVGASFPSGDGCNTCTCRGNQRKGSNAAVVCTKTPVADCFADPCQVHKCPAFPAATCQSNYCGGCNADWFVNGHKVDCNASSPSTPPTCLQGGNIKPIDCPAGYTCHLTPVTTPLKNPDSGRQGVCLRNGQAPAPAPARAPVPTRAPVPAHAPAPAAGCQCGNSTYQVCGQDGVTYQNPCMARCKGASYFPGPCGSCNCPTDWEPVCGSDNKTYVNTCDAQCHGISGPYKKGECGAQTSSCGCSNEENPVCGSDGKTYRNACLAKCAKKSYFPGECGQCICIAVYSPVCSSTGALYGNECEARCHGASPPFTKPGTGGTCLGAPSSGSTGTTGR